MVYPSDNSKSKEFSLPASPLKDSGLPELNEGDELFEHFRFVVDKGQEPVRIDKYLLNKIEKVSRNKIQIAADQELILVDGNPIKSNYKVRPGDEIVIMLPEPKIEFETLPENIPLSILFEDNDIIIINKPAGLVVHPGAGNYTGTLVNGLHYHLQNSGFSESGKSTAIKLIPKDLKVFNTFC